MPESEKLNRLKEWINGCLQSTGYSAGGSAREAFSSVLAKIRSLEGQSREEDLFRGRFDGED